MTKTQIDRLGERLKKGQATAADLRLLDEFRRSFSPVYENVIETITEQLRLKPTGRPAKSTSSVSDKLNRESIRLTQIQDIAGCRLIVLDIAEQDRVVVDLIRLLPGSTIIDRRTLPSNGYRAVHVVTNSGGKHVEIQVRTSLQHLWAEVSEKIADVMDPAIKYGKGNEGVRTYLAGISELVASLESTEPPFEATIPSSPSNALLQGDEELRKLRGEVRKMLEKTIEILKGDGDAVSD